MRVSSRIQTAGALILKALADNVNDVRGTVSNSLSADLRQRPGLRLNIKPVQMFQQATQLAAVHAE